MPKVLVAVPGEEIKIQVIGGESKALHDLVGGPLECVQLGSGFILYCNHEGSSLDLAVNPHFAQGIVKGNFVIAKTEQEGSIGLDDDDIAFVMKTFIRTEEEAIRS